MRNVSNDYLKTMESRRDFYADAEVTFADGTIKTIEKNDLRLSGNSIIHSAGSSSFPLGMLVAKRITLSLENEDDKWSEYDFFGAKIQLFTRFNLENGNIESVNIGEFTVITPETYGTTVEVIAMDASYKTDVSYSTNLTYPLSLGEALRDSCQTCGITLLTTTFANDDFVIDTLPENLTHRQFIGLCAMLAGGNAVLDEYNRLKIITYDLSALDVPGLDGGKFDKLGLSEYVTGDTADGGAFNPWNTGYVMDGGAFGDRRNIHVLYEIKSGMTVGVDDVVITGVQMTDDDGEVHLYGKEGYVITIENQLASVKKDEEDEKNEGGNKEDKQVKEDEVVRRIGEKIVGLRFRPFTADNIAYPLAEFMDPAFIIDRKQNVYQTVLTDIEFNYFGYTRLKCTADSPIRNSSKYNSEAAKAVVTARKLVKEERTARERAVDNLANRLANSSGLYMTAETQPDGSTIYYMHDKPTLKESMIIWKLTAEAFAISTDGGKTYPYGFTVDGELITRLLYAEGIDADYINTGALRISDNSGNVLFYADYNTKEVRINASKVYIGTSALTDNLVEMAAAISIANDNINLKVSKGDVSSQLSVESGQIKIKSDRFSWESTNSSLTADGKLTAKDVDISGKINADSGEIGGLTIDKKCIRYNKLSFKDGRSGLYIGQDGIAVGYGGSIDSAFMVTSSGDVTVGAVGDFTLEKGLLKLNGDISYIKHKTNNAIEFKNYQTSIVSSNAIIGPVGGHIGFFGSTPVVKKSVSKITSTSTATASDVASKVNDLLDALKAYNLIG